MYDPWKNTFGSVGIPMDVTTTTGKVGFTDAFLPTLFASVGNFCSSVKICRSVGKRRRSLGPKTTLKSVVGSQHSTLNPNEPSLSFPFPGHRPPPSTHSRDRRKNGTPSPFLVFSLSLSHHHRPPSLTPSRFKKQNGSGDDVFARLFAASLDPDFAPLSLEPRILKSRLIAGKTLYGLFLLRSSPTLAEIAGLAGYDYGVVDMEHDSGGIAEALPCLLALAAAFMNRPSSGGGVAPAATQPQEPHRLLRRHHRHHPGRPHQDGALRRHRPQDRRELQAVLHRRIQETWGRHRGAYVQWEIELLGFEMPKVLLTEEISGSLRKLKDSGKHDDRMMSSLSKGKKFKCQMPQPCLESYNAFVFTRGTKKRPRVSSQPVERCNEASRKMRAIEKDGRSERIFGVHSSQSLEKVDAVASPRTVLGEKCLYASLNIDVKYCPVTSSEPSDAESTSSSVGSCSTSNSPYRSPHCPGMGLSQDLSSRSDDAESCCGSGRESSLPTKEVLAAEIHQLELHAYCSTMRAFYASGPISWDQEALMTDLRLMLNISNDEHLLELKNLVSSEIGRTS
ncbi:uncharacterized protein LOC120111716 [Phoenix dactylifera]|uniref:Uncharacterized protein LOC120111716 n=1 Tax=Phoenix dactylifera TaxID=42345 RepID=A0A8B9AI94_PHODC|nr:uncharacterized protein LOC120111716 [Phoenix dactylifera]